VHVPIIIPVRYLVALQVPEDNAAAARLSLHSLLPSLMDLLSRNSGLVAPTGVAVLVAYVTLCRGFRFLRRDMKLAHYPYKTREEFKNMTAEHAYEIVQYVQGLEFPFIATKALAFALFRSVLVRRASTVYSHSDLLDVEPTAFRPSPSSSAKRNS
jgi:hypothetical protein